MFSRIASQPAISSRPITLAMNYPAKKSAVLYHYPCPDGAFAALAAHLYFSATSSPVLFFPNTVYSPIRAEQLPLDEIEDLYLLDYVGPSGFVQELSSGVERVIVLDHHKTALEALGCNDDDASVGENVVKVIDMERSGATIAYDYFKEKLGEANSCERDDGFEETRASGRVPADFTRLREIFEYVEDGDLWKWHLHDSKYFHNGLKDLNIEFDVMSNPSMFEQLLSLDLESVIIQGKATSLEKQKLIDGALQQSFEIALGGGTFGRCLAVYADSISELRSELGHQLACKSRSLELRGIGAVVYQVPDLENDQRLKISLRSDGEDTTPVSQKFGGGGHRNASSFILSLSEFQGWKV